MNDNPFDECNPNDINLNYDCNDDSLSNLNNYEFKNTNIYIRNSVDDNDKNRTS
jgi:hypothetical protein